MIDRCSITFLSNLSLPSDVLFAQQCFGVSTTDVCTAVFWCFHNTSTYPTLPQGEFIYDSSDRKSRQMNRPVRWPGIRIS